ncbi:MAG TPA: YceI family protein [Steroidobacteraceae bacterium]
MKALLLVLPLLTLSACSKQERSAEASPSETINTQTAAEFAAPADLPAGAYKLDRSHASLVFRVDHLGFSKYTARFRTFDAQLQLDPRNLAASSVVVSVDPKSLDLDGPPEGFLEALLGPEWLDAAQFPTLAYRSTKVEPIGPNAVRITGDLTLHGITHPVVLEATLNGGWVGHPFDPNARVGFSARGTFKRSDFGISTGLPPPGTKMGVSDEVEVIVETEFTGPAWKSAEALDTVARSL